MGSTGSIGRSVVDVIKSFPGKFKVVGLLAGSNTQRLNEQIRLLKPKYVGIYSCKKFKDVEFDSRRLYCAEEALFRLSSLKEAQMVVFALPGFGGYKALFSALRSSKTIALANKEILISFGDLVLREARKYSSTIIPVDSEHSALWQCLRAWDRVEVSKIYLTCSGGPFWNWPKVKLKKVGVREVLRHPCWKMGKKISVDSATLINKGLEAIEAHYLFKFSYEDIRILIHPQAIIHGIIEMKDSCMFSYMSPADMRLPILYALSFPQRWQVDFVKLDLARIKNLTFSRPDFKKFPGLQLALDAGRRGKTFPCVFNACDEVCVDYFLRGSLRYLDIPFVIEKVLNRHRPAPKPTIPDVVSAYNWAIDEARSLLSGLRRR